MSSFKRDECCLTAHLVSLVGPVSQVGRTKMQLLSGRALAMLCTGIALSEVSSASSFPVFSTKRDDESCDQPCSPCATFIALI